MDPKSIINCVFPHQVCQIGLISTHELPLLADGCHPLIDSFVEILSDVVLQVVSVVSKKENNEHLDIQTLT